jgi:Ran GTPase-activating protein (RanGAP) involved in mRNA processing and transport
MPDFTIRRAKESIEQPDWATYRGANDTMAESEDCNEEDEDSQDEVFEPDQPRYQKDPAEEAEIDSLSNKLAAL